MYILFFEDDLVLYAWIDDVCENKLTTTDCEKDNLKNLGLTFFKFEPVQSETIGK